MNKMQRKWTAGAILALALVGVSFNVVRGDDDDDDKKLKADMLAAKKAVLASLEGKVDLAKLAKDNKIEPTMKLFKPASKGGVGIGTLKGAGHKDSIELLIRDYAIKPPTKAEVTKYADDIVKAAQITNVIAGMTPYWAPTKDGGMGKTKAKWLELTEDMKKNSADLVKAAKAMDEKAVDSVSKKLNNSCAECHKIFRDDK